MAASTITLTKSDKQEIKKTLFKGINAFVNDADYPLDNLGKNMLKTWSKDIDNYYELILYYLYRNPNDNTVSDIIVKGIFPYVMAFQEFFTLHQLKAGELSEECKKNNEGADNKEKFGPILYEKLQNGKTYKLSDGYCYDLMELHGISKQSVPPYKSPFTRQDLDTSEQVFLMFIKSFKDNKISEFANTRDIGTSSLHSTTKKGRGTKGRKPKKKSTTRKPKKKSTDRKPKKKNTTRKPKKKNTTRKPKETKK